jgi:hypothetical protein
MKRIAVLAFAGLAMGLASPLAAEQTVPPAAQAEPPAPPMPPMPNARHRWVDIDGASRASHKARPARHAAAAKRDAKAVAGSKTHKSAKSTKNSEASKHPKTSKHFKAGKSTKSTKISKASKHLKASKSDKASKHIKADKTSKASANHRTDRKDKGPHFSAKTVRSCHAMTYRQILRSSSCRAMISEELSGSSGRAASRHKAAAKKKTAAKTAKHKSSPRKR